MIRDAFADDTQGRAQIINDVILPCIDKPRENLSPYAPKIVQITIPVGQIREVIGSGGKVIQSYYRRNRRGN